MTEPSDDSDRGKESKLPAIVGAAVIGLGVVTASAPFILYFSAAKNKPRTIDYYASVVLGASFFAIGLIISKRKTRNIEERDIPIAIYPAHRPLYLRIRDYLHRKAL